MTKRTQHNKKGLKYKPQVGKWGEVPYHEGATPKSERRLAREKRNQEYEKKVRER